MAIKKMRSKEEVLESKESKLTRMFKEMNENREGGRYETLVCETECTMARIRSLSDFLYLLRVKPIQTLCYYGAAAFFLLTLAALWCSEWLLAAIFAAIFLALAFAPHNMRIAYFNKQADEMEQSYGKIINAEFTEDKIILSVSKVVMHEQELDEEGNAVARRSALAKDEESTIRIEILYKDIATAFECSHSFYIFPMDEKKKRMDTIICDKTQFLRGTPMELRDRLARGCGKRFKIKVKKA